MFLRSEINGCPSANETKKINVYPTFISQKPESFLKPLVDQYAKEGKDKKVVFEANFSKPNCKPKWFFRKDVSFSSSNPYMCINQFYLHPLFSFFPPTGTVPFVEIQVQERGRLLPAHHHESQSGGHRKVHDRNFRCLQYCLPQRRRLVIIYLYICIYIISRIEKNLD